MRNSGNVPGGGTKGLPLVVQGDTPSPAHSPSSPRYCTVLYMNLYSTVHFVMNLNSTVQYCTSTVIYTVLYSYLTAPAAVIPGTVFVLVQELVQEPPYEYSYTRTSTVRYFIHGLRYSYVSQMLFVPRRPSRPWPAVPWPAVPWPAVLSVRHAFAVCHKMWPYRRDFDAANLSKKFKCKNEPCRTIFRG